MPEAELVDIQADQTWIPSWRAFWTYRYLLKSLLSHLQKGLPVKPKWVSFMFEIGPLEILFLSITVNFVLTAQNLKQEPNNSMKQTQCTLPERNIASEK